MLTTAGLPVWHAIEATSTASSPFTTLLEHLAGRNDPIGGLEAGDLADLADQAGAVQRQRPQLPIGPLRSRRPGVLVVFAGLAGGGEGSGDPRPRAAAVRQLPVHDLPHGGVGAGSGPYPPSEHQQPRCNRLAAPS